MNHSMNTPSNAIPETPGDSRAITPAAFSATRPFYWSVRRELWENRSIYIAPLVAAGIGILAFLIGLFGLPKSMRQVEVVGEAAQTVMIIMPYAHVAMLVMVTALFVGFFYSLEALHGERRDRSILFWKSLPVSDLTTVLSKAIIPLVVLPVIVFVIIVITQLLMLLINCAALLMSGTSLAMTWAHLPLFQTQLVVLYGLTVFALWHAPIYMWLLLVSGWARRATFLWAVLPPFAIAAFARIAFRSSYLFNLLVRDRIFGFAAYAFDFDAPRYLPIDPHFIPLGILTPGKFLSSPGLWIGLFFAAAFLAAAVRMRRYREPI